MNRFHALEISLEETAIEQLALCHWIDGGKSDRSQFIWVRYALFRLDLPAIDDFGLKELDLDKCRDFFEVIDRQDGQRFKIIISQIPIKSWFDLFWEHTCADTCLVRITDKQRSYHFEMNGINIRKAEKYAFISKGAVLCTV